MRPVTAKSVMQPRMSAFDKSGNENAGAGVEARPPRLNLPCDDMCGSEKAAVRQVDNSNAKLAVGAVWWFRYTASYTSAHG